MRAAQRAAQRLKAEGRRVMVAVPPVAGTDANDLLRAGRRRGAGGGARARHGAGRGRGLRAGRGGERGRHRRRLLPPLRRPAALRPPPRPLVHLGEDPLAGRGDRARPAPRARGMPPHRRGAAARREGGDEAPPRRDHRRGHPLRADRPAACGHLRHLGPGPLRPRHARRHRRPAHRPAPRRPARRPHHPADRRRTGGHGRVPDLARASSRTRRRRTPGSCASCSRSPATA